jgi:hypothetical protein
LINIKIVPTIKLVSRARRSTGLVKQRANHSLFTISPHLPGELHLLSGLFVTFHGCIARSSEYACLVRFDVLPEALECCSGSD